MIVDGRIRFKHVLQYLDVDKIPGCDDAPEDWIEFFDCVDVDEYDFPEDACKVCGGVEPEPEQSVDPWLIRDFVAAIKAGNIHRAQQLVGRVFDVTEDIATVENALCKCAA